MRSLFGKKHKDTATSSSSAGLHRKPTGGKVFGTPLIDVCEREKTEIPQVATEVMEYLDKNGLKVEGIFRIPGNSIQIQQLQDYYDCIEPKKASDALTIDTVDDVHAVACVLKQYLRDLPDPLLTHRFYDTFIAIMKNPDYDYRISNIKKLITALPPAHKSLLQHLFSFLLRVAAQSDVNKMTFPNLAIVFGPNLLRPRHESMLRMIEDARHVNSLIKLLLEEYEFLIMGTTDKPKNAALYKKPDPTPAPASAPVVIAAGSTPSTPKGVSTNPAIAGGRAHTDRRRAFKFDPADLSTQTFTEDESVDPGEKEARTEPPAKPRRAGAAAVTASIGLPPSKRMSAMGVILMTPEMEQEVKEFDLTRPLQHAMSLLNLDRQKCARGADCSTMNPLQLKAEKAAVKRILRNFDVSFKEKHGHLPNKADKEPLRPLYQQYRELTQIIDNTIPPPVPARGTAPKPAVVDEQVKLLRKEKRQLQLFLHKYQEEFIARNGRKVQYLEDRLPVQREYDRYKELKLQLADGD